MDHDLRFAIIGASASIVATHLDALRDLPGATIVGMADIVAARGAERAAAAGCPFFTDYREMLDAIRPDVAVVCVPHPLHASVSRDCIAVGCHVLSEKPVAIDVADADALIAAAAAAGKVVAVNFQQRFRPAIVYLKRLIEAGELGDLVRVLCVEPWYRTAFYYRTAPWRGSWAGEGGGVLMNQGPHPLDLLCHLVGSPARVTGWTRTRAHAIECEDSAQAMLEYPNGAPGYIYFSTVEAGLHRRTEIVGDRAAVELVEDRLTIHRFAPPLSQHRAESQEMWGSPQVTSETIELASGDGGGHRAVYEDLIVALHDGRRPRCDASDALMGLELANAIIYSSQIGAPVELPLDRAAYSAMLARLRGATE